MKRLRDTGQRGANAADTRDTAWRSCACLTAPMAVRYRTVAWWRCRAWLRPAP